MNQATFFFGDYANQKCVQAANIITGGMVLVKSESTNQLSLTFCNDEYKVVP